MLKLELLSTLITIEDCGPPTGLDEDLRLIKIEGKTTIVRHPQGRDLNEWTAPSMADALETFVEKGGEIGQLILDRVREIAERATYCDNDENFAQYLAR